MIQSLFILSPLGEVLIERHFRGVVTSRSVCDTFWEQASLSINHHGGVSATTSLNMQVMYNYDTVPPVIEVPESDQGSLYIISILRDGLSYLAVCPAEISPLLVLEFLQRIARIFVEYFGEPADEAAIKDNFSTVYQLLEEMVDYGWPLTTEPNALKAMIRPSTVVSKFLLQAGSTVSDELPSGTVSNIPWRTADLHYSNNEIYLDIIEEVDAIVDASGAVVSSDVSGSIQCQSQLSGIPDLLLTFKDPQLIDDCCFHPCVRYARFEKDQVVSFVPPDGNFELMRYRINPDTARSFAPPIYCRTQYTYAPIDQNNNNNNNNTSSNNSSSNGSTPSSVTMRGRLSLQVGLASLSNLVVSSAIRKGPPQVEEVAITIPFPRQTRATTDFNVSMGTILYDEAAKVARWKIGNLEPGARPTLSCSFTVTKTIASKRPENEDSDTESVIGANNMPAPPNLNLHWKIPLASVSGLTVSGLSVMGENYRPYKGVRNITKSGLFQVRCY